MRSGGRALKFSRRIASNSLLIRIHHGIYFYLFIFLFVFAFVSRN